eukprot:TRINITY_DN1413_c0_g1_i6.p1 TRINITY_DN1413_c0_g1~~TRINITY_DN1413_c0_g1_i6.p1  ORF type:complete len:270 (-),score=45.27 TRINITY_DN1413_c0_g1_i6:691-1458(-)
MFALSRTVFLTSFSYRHCTNNPCSGSTVRLIRLVLDKYNLSRVEATRAIQKGFVKVNGTTTTEVGARISVDSTIDCMEGFKDPIVVYALNKPVGVLSRPERNGNPYLTDFLPPEPVVFPSGRLDKDSSGLIILSNDGSLVYQLIGKDTKYEKEYHVTVTGTLTEGVLRKLREGVNVLGSLSKPVRVVQDGRHSFFITLTEGKNRQIRRMCRTVGLTVIQLHRVRIGGYRLPPDVPEGCWKILNEKEKDLLLKPTE